MKIDVKLYGGLTCLNRDLGCYGEKRFRLDMAEGTALSEVHKLLLNDPAPNLVSLVNGRAEQRDFVLDESCIISIFPPMADRKYNLFDSIK